MKRSGLAALLVGLVTLVAACSGDDGKGDDGSSKDQPEHPQPKPKPQQIDAKADDFYAPPDPLTAGEHGDLLRYQLVDNPPDGVTWYRVMYLSESVGGEPIVVTGVITVPDGDPPTGGWPVVSHAHGSTGLGDPCAPSINVDDDRMFALELGLLAGSATKHGVVVASTDYEGLGGPGIHPFLVGESEGRGVLDIALAARQLPGVEVGQQTAIAGYSQGGHAALWANQIAADWTPDLDIVGTMAGAPASELLTSSDGFPVEVRQQFEVTLVAGFAAAYPEADMSAILTPAGQDVVDRLATDCPPVDGVDPKVPLLQARPSQTEPWATFLRENTPGAVAAPSPLLIVHSAKDANVPIAGSAALLDRLCGVDQVVERRVLPEGDHVAAAVPAYEQAFAWFDTLWQGGRPASSCP